MREMWGYSSEGRAARRATDCPYSSGQMELPQALSGPAVQIRSSLTTHFLMFPFKPVHYTEDLYP